MKHCTLCHAPLSNKMDDEFYACTTCGGLVKDSLLYPDWDTERKRYLEHNNDVNDPRYQKFTSPITQFILENYSSEDKGLDYGSGTGPVISKVLRDEGFDINVYDPFFAPDETVLQSSYDYIVSCEVFEHFFDPHKEISRLKDLLKPGGRLVIMTLLYHDDIDFRNWAYRKDITHVFIYREETFHFIARDFDMHLELIDGRLVVLRNK